MPWAARGGITYGRSTIMGGKIAGLAGKGQLCNAIGQINRPRILRALTIAPKNILEL